jgi:hypothetical protein
MNDVLALCLDQTGTLILDDVTINILYQKHIIDSTSGIHADTFLHALLKKAKWKLNECMPTSLYIEQATSIGSFLANLERLYVQLSTIVVTFEDKAKSRFFLRSIDLLIVWTTLLMMCRYQINWRSLRLLCALMIFTLCRILCGPLDAVASSSPSSSKP